MPELPEVQTVVDTLSQFIIDKEIIDVNVIKGKIIAKPKEVQEFIRILEGSKIEGVRRRGKYIIINLDNQYYYVTHLRMTGRFIYSKEEEQDKYDCIIFGFDDGSRLRLGSKRKFTRTYLVKKLDEAGSLTKLGPEPLLDEFTLDKFKKMLINRRGRIKPLLLNQKFLAGLGNIYVDEALFIAKIHPVTTADALNGDQIEKLYDAIRQVLSEGIKYRGTTKWDYVDAAGRSGSYQEYLRVYDKEGKECINCGNKLERIKVGGRSSYFCPSCQKRE